MYKYNLKKLKQLIKYFFFIIIFNFFFWIFKNRIVVGCLKSWFDISNRSLQSCDSNMLLTEEGNSSAGIHLALWRKKVLCCKLKCCILISNFTSPLLNVCSHIGGCIYDTCQNICLLKYFENIGKFVISWTKKIAIDSTSSNHSASVAFELYIQRWQMQSRHALNKYNGASATNISVYVNRCHTDFHSRQQTEDNDEGEQIEIARKIPFERPFHYFVPTSSHTSHTYINACTWRTYVCVL